MYNKKIDEKWQKIWEEKEIYKYDPNSKGEKFYQLEMFSYPSGDKLHLGHWYNYAPMDTYARFKKMNGYNLFHPMGFDAFGLPAENYAIKTGIHPKISTKDNIENMTRQIKEMGASYDWSYELETCDPSYYKFTQWLFSILYKNGMAYQKEAPVNFCPSCNTVLANEQVKDGTCERCDTIVERKNLKQWFFKITDYAEELLDGLENLNWPELTKKIQTNWIGKSKGVEIDFKFEDGNEIFKIFTTRPDTIFGVKYISIAPEFKDIYKYVSEDKKAEVEKYILETNHISEIERQSNLKEKTGVFTGKYAINPVTEKKIPIYVADYVLASYGSGVVMGVPAHDQRDFEFAKKYNIDMIQVITNEEENIDISGESFTEVGENTKLINSNFLNGLNTIEATKKIIEYLEEKEIGRTKTQYRLKDWLISRQRYWGAPIPIIHCKECGAVLDENLPVLLPDDVEFKPTGESPLAKSESFINTICPKCGKEAKREADTLDTFVCSSWYFLRFPFEDLEDKAFDKEKVNDILPVDIYIGGKEHAAMHLIYARYITKALRDLGYLKFDEPFTKLVHQGLILGPDGNKMSKSKGNTINPDTYVEKYGSDVLRMYLMFAFKYEEGGPWDDNGINGMAKFFSRVETLFMNILKLKEEQKNSEDKSDKEEKELEYEINKALKEVTEDVEKQEFNTAIARLMEALNAMTKYYKQIEEAEESEKGFKSNVLIKTFETYTIMLSIFAPHFSQEMWERLGHKDFLYNLEWPKYDEKKIEKETINLPIQINGKVRQLIEIDKQIKQEELKKIIHSDDKIKTYIDGKEIIKEIYIEGRIYNIVIK